MKNLLIYTGIFLLPFLFIVLINESVRSNIKEKPYTSQGITAINSTDFLPNKCTWACYNNTSYCKLHHVKFMTEFYETTDIFYFGLIGILASTGYYNAANIIFLVFLFPLSILYFFAKSIKLQKEIQKLLNNKDE